ncbi:MAG: hypothetical protein DGJ47_001126 [Rickettsiaceae bacterium]
MRQEKDSDITNGCYICWAHLARDFERLSNSSYANIKNLGLELVPKRENYLP